MLTETITSRQNPLVKRLLAVRQGRERHVIFVEGIRLVEEALKSGLHVEAVAFSNLLTETERGRALFDRLQALPCRGAFLTDKLMAAVTDVQAPQGVIALATRPHYEPARVLEAIPALIVLVDGMQDPGNLGALIRTAEAAGASGIITTRLSADPFHPKALRSSAGAAFRLPIATHQGWPETAKALREEEIRLVAADAGAPLKFTDYDWRQPTALWFGSEGNGLPTDLVRQPDVTVGIPMAGRIESLNITVAGALLLYEAARQRDTFAIEEREKE